MLPEAHLLSCKYFLLESLIDVYPDLNIGIYLNKFNVKALKRFFDHHLDIPSFVTKYFQVFQQKSGDSDLDKKIVSLT